MDTEFAFRTDDDGAEVSISTIGAERLMVGPETARIALSVLRIGRWVEAGLHPRRNASVLHLLVDELLHCGIKAEPGYIRREKAAWKKRFGTEMPAELCDLNQ